MSVPALFAQARLELAQDPTVRARELDYHAGTEVGLKNPNTDGALLLRDDGVAELAGGPGVSVRADGSQHQVTLEAPAVALVSEHQHLLAPNVYLRYHRLDPLGLWTPPLVDVATWLWEHAPLVQQYPGALGEMYLTGVPQDGQMLVPFAKPFKAKPLFGPDETLLILTKNLALLLKGIVPH